MRVVRLVVGSFITFALVVVGSVSLGVIPQARAATTPVTIEAPTLIRATGALLSWSRVVLASGASFSSYAVHRSSTPGFVPSADNRIATYTDVGRTVHLDATASPGRPWTYVVVTTTTDTLGASAVPSAEISVTTPAAGTAKAVLQPGGATGSATMVAQDLTSPVACYTGYNFGRHSQVHVGSTAGGNVFRGLLDFDLRRIPAGATVTAATLTLTAPKVTTAYTSDAVTVQRLTRPFVEGTEVGSCAASGASWLEAANGTRWTAAGGDAYATSGTVGTGATIPAKARSTTVDTVDTANVLSMVKAWVAGTAPNHGMLLRATTEATVAPLTSTNVTYGSDDHASAASRPRLEVTYTDTAAVPASRVLLGTPGSDAAVRGSVALTASASDDSRVTSMDFLIDGQSVGTDSTEPFSFTWSSTTATRGTHTFSARATDDSGTVSSSTVRSFTVDNQAAPTGSLATVPNPYTGARTLTATASDDVGIDRVEFTVDDTLVGVGAGTGSSRTLSWNSMHPLHGVSDGAHTVAAYAIDTAGQRTLLGSQTVTVANNQGGIFSAALRLNDPTTTADDAWPPLTSDNSDPGLAATPVNLYDGTMDATGLWSPSATSSGTTSGTLTSVPKDSTSGMTKTVSGTSSTASFTTSSPSGAAGASTVARVSGAGATPSPTTATTASTSPSPTPTTAPASPTPVATKSSSVQLAPQVEPTPFEPAPAEPAPPADYVPPPTFACPDEAYCPVVTVTNTSEKTWTGDRIRVWYRWYAPNGAIAFEGPASDTFVNSFPKNKTKSFRLVVYPPALPTGVELGQYTLRIDLFDTDTSTWFASKGNRPLENPVIVAKSLQKNLGFEKFWTYAGGQTGAGSLTAANVSNGNLLWRWSPWTAPGRGLASVMDLTYNSLEDHSRSPVGESFSLAVSGLSRLGEPIEIHPNKADQISGKARKYVEFVDGDGTVHRFEGQADGSWKRPAGVHLLLRSVTTVTTAPQYWAISRPDGVTFYYDYDGFPTAVKDRNGNTVTFVLQTTPAGEDPGGPKKRVSVVRDAGGRDFTITYWSKAEEKNGRVRGNVKRITDHTNSAIDFEYYSDGNLRKLIQRGGVGDDGAYTADRQFVFTYTTSNGSGPAITDATVRKNPPQRTPNQSTKLFSVRDPKGVETSFTYYGASEAPKLRWFVKSRTDRATSDGAAVTTFSYDLVNRLTTVKDALAKPTTYLYDTQGRATRITNAKGEATQYRWTADNHVDLITEPNQATQQFTYDDRGYLTTKVNQEAERTNLTYLTRKVLATDAAPWLSLLTAVEQPKGVLTPGDLTDFRTTFTYDAVGNVETQTDPEGGVSRYDWFDPGTSCAGVLRTSTDPLGNTTTVDTCDANGLATKITDAAGGVTTFGYTADGLARWTQTPLHQSPAAGLADRSYRSYTDYDAFHRAVRSSTPKSTTLEPGVLVWSGQDYDANNNVTGQRSPTYGVGEPGSAPVGIVTFDEMDRPLAITSPDTFDGAETNAKDYDLIGRLVAETAPKGVASATVAGDYTTSYSYDLVDRVVTTKRQGAAAEAPRRSWLCYDSVGNRVAAIQDKANLAGPPTSCPLAQQPWTFLMRYDKAHRTIGSTDASGRTTSQDYDDNGQVVRAVNEAGTVQTFAYDERGLVTEQKNTVSATRWTTARMRYDLAGNLVKQISPRAVDKGTETDYVTTFSYDALNRQITKGLPKDATTDAAWEHMVYDADGRMVRKTLPIASQTLPAELSPNAASTTRYFDTGWIAGSQQAGVPEVLFDYTPQGWQAERVPRQTTAPGSPRNESLAMFWQYYDDGQIRSRMDEQGLPIVLEYDQHNLLTKGTVTAGVVEPSQVPMSTTVSYTGYDEVSRAGETQLVDTETARVTNFTDFSYDTHGLLVGRGDLGKASNTGAVTQAVRRNAFEYDSLDRLVTQWELGTATTCTDDRRILSTWSGEDWLKTRSVAKATASCTAEKSATAADWAVNQLDEKTYLLNGDLASNVTKNGAGVVQEQHTLSYEQDGAWVGQRTSDVFLRKTPDAGKPCSTSTCTSTWALNARDQVTRYASGTGDVTTYTLDESAQQADSLVRAGNVTKEVAPDGTVTTRKYVGNQMSETSTSLSGVTNTTRTIYDDLGRTDCIVKEAGSAADCATSGAVSANLVTDYSYDYLDRLSAVRSYSGGTLQDESEYTSDALDRVVKQTEMHKGAGTENRTVAFTYLGLSENLSSEVSTSTGSRTDAAVSGDSSTKTYSYDAYMTRYRMTDSSKVDKADGTSSTTTATATYASDPHSSVSMLLHDSGTEAGTVKAAYGYTAYGDQDDKLSSGDTDKKKPFNPFRYSGQRYDSGSGTLQTGARRYDPGATRFLQQDVFKNAVADLGLTMDPLSQNRYALASGNPTGNIEIDGHRVVANGSGGGTVRTSPDTPTGGDLKAAGTNSEEYYEALSVDKEFDIGEKLLDAGMDFIGVTDVKDCIENPSVGGCAMAVANFIPWSKVFKAGKLGKKLFELAGEFMEWRKAREAADALIAKVDDAAKRSDGAATKADNPGTSCKLANSFTGKTRVVMADGSRKPISAVRKGDVVKAMDPATGKVSKRKVTGTIATKGDKALVELRLADGGRISATTGHPVWDQATKRWVDAGQLKGGDLVRTQQGRVVAVGSVEARMTNTSVYNLSVDVDHTYLVDTGTSTALVHNCRKDNSPSEEASGAADKGGGAGETVDNVGKAQSGADESFSSFRAAKRAMGSPGKGKEWDHVVEQSQTKSTRSGFSVEAVNSRSNFMALSKADHQRKTAFYASKPRGIFGDKTVRDWLNGQTFAEQHEFGLDVIGAIRNNTPLPGTG